jgi:hypothetical protein
VLPASVMSAGSDDPAPVTLEVQLAGGARGTRQLTVDLSGTADLPRSAFRTSTIWTAGRARFVGVRLHDLLAHLGVDSGRATLRAANGYTAEIPVAEVRPDGALLAFERDGARMTLRDKGPVWLLYPFDSAPRFRTELHYARSVWQLDRIEIAR